MLQHDYFRIQSVGHFWRRLPGQSVRPSRRNPSLNFFGISHRLPGHFPTPLIANFKQLRIVHNINVRVVIWNRTASLDRREEPILPRSAVDLLNKGETPLAIAIAFDGSGNVREAHVVKSSGVPAADEVVREPVWQLPWRSSLL
jgi:hypothetical protein